MSDFTRTLRPGALDSLRRLAEVSGENWWKDLLTLWRPSGTVAELYGLRLAIRNNYLNFYSRGQSVARVGFTPACEAYVETHVKYVFGQDEIAQDYARLTGTEIWRSKIKTEMKYEGASTLMNWISGAGRHTGREKQCVDDLVADNPSIIDLEMGLPAAGKRTTAQRMDCVALEEEGDVIRIVFWEAKMIDDGRLRSRSKPEVVDQVKIYRDYLSESDQARSVVAAYRTVCLLLNEIGAMAASFGKEPKLDHLILKAAKEDASLNVDPEPRLVIFLGKAHQNKGNWPYHEDRLWKDFKIPYLVFEQGPYALRRPEMKV